MFIVGKWVKLSRMKKVTLTKHVDSKGRLTLGESFANATVIVESREDVVVITRARVIPEREAWLYENKAALASVRRGLQQAAERRFVPGPDLGAAAELAERITIARAGKPVALLGPPQKARRRSARLDDPLLRADEYSFDGSIGSTTNKDIDRTVYGL